MAWLFPTLSLMHPEVADAAERQRMIADIRERFGRLDVLVNNAGVAPTERADILDAGEARDRDHRVFRCARERGGDRAGRFWRSSG